MKTYLLLIPFLAMTLHSNAQTVSDVDGNTYNTVTIGTQVWMKKNLKTTKYNDGATIPNVTSLSAWVALTTPAYCWNSFNINTYKATYGALYNWYVISTDKLCPIGWHVPADSEWNALVISLGGLSVAGGKLKEAGTTHWQSPNQGADNSSGFTGLPGGFLDPVNVPANFHSFGFDAYWWSSTENNTTNASSISVSLHLASTYIDKFDKRFGLSVRCLKDSNSVDQTTVTFNADGGSTVPILVITKNTAITQPADPTKQGYNFAGWYKETACNNAWDFTTDVVSAPIILYAKWTKVNTSIGGQTVADHKLYPNPAKDKIYIHSNSGNASGAIFNLQGERVVEIMAGVTQIDISSLSKGVYVIKIITSGNIYVDKLIKE